MIYLLFDSSYLFAVVTGVDYAVFDIYGICLRWLFLRFHVGEFYLLLIVPGESRGLSEAVSLSRDLVLSCHYWAHDVEKFVSLYDIEAYG